MERLFGYDEDYNYWKVNYICLYVVVSYEFIFSVSIYVFGYVDELK